MTDHQPLKKMDAETFAKATEGYTTDDPNEDLIGLEIEYVGDGCAYIVDGTVPW